MQLPLTIVLKPSRYFATILFSGHALAGVAVFILSMQMHYLGFAFLPLFLSCIYVQWRHVHQGGRHGIKTLVLRADGKIDVALASGAVQTALVLPYTTVFSSLVVLGYRYADNVGAVVLLPDAMQSDLHRQMRLWLRWRADISHAGRSSIRNT